MLHRLNYYSRYNRIKTPKEIGTLYHLFQDLNIDAIVNDDFISRISALRQAHLKDKNDSKKIPKYNQQKSSRREQYEYSKKFRRSDDNQKLGGYQKYTQRSGSLEPKQHSIQSQQLEAHQKNSISASFRMSKNKTGNLSQMRCLQTQSIPQSLKQIEIKEQNSPIFKLKQQQLQGKSIQKGEIKQCESQYFETNIKQKQAYLRSSNFDEFSEGLGQLNKVDQIRKSSYFKNTENNQNHIKSAIQQDYYSEQLDRFYGSDIQMQIQHNYQYQNQYHQEQVEVEVEKECQKNQIMIEENTDNVEDNQDYNQIMPILYNGKSVDYVDDFREQVEIQEQYQLENQEQQQKNQQSSCIDIQASNLQQQQSNLDSPIFKITGNDLTQGKWAITQTKQSIQPTVGADSFMAPLVTSNSNNEKQRKPFKKMIMDRKLNARLVTSTIVHDPPVKKVNFKKMMKKQTAENIAKAPIIQNKPIKDIKPPSQKKLLLKAFFDQN